MLSKARIGAIVFFVADLDRSIAFYRDTLGLDVIGHEGHATAAVGGLELVFIPGDARPGRSPVVVFGVERGIDDYAELLAARGVEIVTPVSDCPDGGLSVDFADPDGSLLSVYQPPGAARRR
jgi:catechol 2,3-dioxygenase-like lactoylglutathione lyase family enzyme